jgi:hypothetical protein
MKKEEKKAKKAKKALGFALGKVGGADVQAWEG